MVDCGIVAHVWGKEMTEKTYKREVAGVLIAVFIGLTIAGMWFPPALGAADSIKFEVFAFAALAFGMDAYSKQVKK